MLMLILLVCMRVFLVISMWGSRHGAMASYRNIGDAPGELQRPGGIALWPEPSTCLRSLTKLRFHAAMVWGRKNWPGAGGRWNLSASQSRSLTWILSSYARPLSKCLSCLCPHPILAACIHYRVSLGQQVGRDLSRSNFLAEPASTQPLNLSTAFSGCRDNCSAARSAMVTPL